MAEAPKKKLFDMALIVELQDEADGSINPFISYKFPEPDENELLGTVKDPFSASVTQFCFPDKDEFPIERMKSEVFSFVLTEADGDKRFGYCLRKLPGGNGPRFPIGYSIMSLFPCYPLYSKILERVAYHYENSSRSHLRSFLTSVNMNEFPRPGQSFEVKAEMSGRVESWRITRPDEDGCQLEYSNFESYLDLLDPSNFLTIFISLLIERRIIFVANSLPVLSSSVQAAVAFLYPFNWQHIFIPVLPTSLLSFCCAPMPFVVGILRTSLDEVLQLPMDEVLIVDIDNNGFLSTPVQDGNDLDLLPSNYWMPLKNMLHTTRKDIKRNKKRRKKNVDSQLEDSCSAYEAKQAAMKLSEIFLEFFMYLFSDWRQFVNGRDFDRQSFVDSRDSDICEFMEMMCGSQMFERFVQERIADEDAVYGTFDKRVERNDPFGQFLSSAQLFGTDIDSAPTTLEDVFGKQSRLSMRPTKTKTGAMFQTLRRFGKGEKDADSGGSSSLSPSASITSMAVSTIARPPTPPRKLAIPPPFVVPKKPLPRPQNGSAAQPPGAASPGQRGRGRGRGMRGRGSVIRRGRGRGGGAPPTKPLPPRASVSTSALETPPDRPPPRRGHRSEHFAQGVKLDEEPEKQRSNTVMHSTPPRSFAAAPEQKKPPRPSGPPPPGKRRSVRAVATLSPEGADGEQTSPQVPPSRPSRSKPDGVVSPRGHSPGATSRSPAVPPRSSPVPRPRGRGAPVPPARSAPPRPPSRQ